MPALVIGFWEYSYTRPDYLLQQLIEQRDKLPKLKALFVGDITHKECEIYWIEQTDYAPLLKAFPRLEQLRVRGSNDLKFTQLKHHSLKKLIIESGGLSNCIIQSLIKAKLPALEHLELWLGDEGYGFNGKLKTIKPLLKKAAFPKLRYLVQREIANAPLLKQL